MKTVPELIEECRKTVMRDVHRYLYDRTDIESCTIVYFSVLNAIEMIYEGEYK